MGAVNTGRLLALSAVCAPGSKQAAPTVCRGSRGLLRGASLCLATITPCASAHLCRGCELGELGEAGVDASSGMLRTWRWWRTWRNLRAGVWHYMGMSSMACTIGLRG